MDEEILTNEFWQTLLHKFTNWVTQDLPGLILMVLLLVAALKVVLIFMRGLNKLLIRRAAYNNGDDKPDKEVEKRINTLVEIVRTGVKVFAWVTIAIVVLNKSGINIAPFLTGVGIIGLALGFGAQELVRDFITGFFILLENQIRKGDVACLNGTSGVVEKIELRTITLRDSSGTVHVFQNGKINSISNLTKEWSAVVFDIRVAYKENIAEVMQVMKDVADGMGKDENFKSKILEPMEINGLENFGDSALIIKGRIKTKPGEQWGIGREYRKRLKETFDMRGIEIPFPQHTVYLYEEEKYNKTPGHKQK